MNEGIHLDLDTWIVPGQILMGKPPPGASSSYKLSRYQFIDHVGTPDPHDE